MYINKECRSHDISGECYMKFCVTGTQKFVGYKLQLSHTRYCVTCTQPFLQCIYSYNHAVCHIYIYIYIYHGAWADQSMYFLQCIYSYNHAVCHIYIYIYICMYVSDQSILPWYNYNKPQWLTVIPWLVVIPWWLKV